jgi:hypothetical protein
MSRSDSPSERLWNAVWLTLRARVLAGSAYRKYKRIL